MAPGGKSRKRSSVWAYMEKKSNDCTMCILCSREFKYSSCTSNMLKHIKTKHPRSFEEMNTAQEGFSANESLEPEDQDHMKEKKSRGRSVVWDHFVKSDEQNVVSCLHCHDTLIRGGGTSNLLKHLQRKHPHELEKSQINSVLKSRSPSPAGEVEEAITSINGNSSPIQEAAGDDDQQFEHMPVIRIDDTTFAVVEGSIAENGESGVKTPVKEKNFPFRKKFKKEKDHTFSPSGLQAQVLKLQKEKLVLEISKLETETIFMKEKLKLEIEKLKEEKEKARSEKELMKLSVTRAKREMGIKD